MMEDGVYRATVVTTDAWNRVHVDIPRHGMKAMRAMNENLISFTLGEPVDVHVLDGEVIRIDKL